MQTEACVSVVIPIYNQAAYLDNCLRCLQGQTHTRLQIVAVNDGSTDGSLAILQRYAEQDARIEIVDQTNGGLVDALYHGIGAARGEYLCFLDPDDLMGQDFIATLLAHVTPDCDFVTAGFYYDFEGSLTPYPLCADATLCKQDLQKLREEFLSDGKSVTPLFHARWNKLYRTELVRKIAAHLPGHRHITLQEDTVFTYLAVCYAQKAVMLAQPNSYFYNVSNPASMMKKDRQSSLQKTQAAAERLRQLAQEFGADEQEAQRLYDGVLTLLSEQPAKTSRLKYTPAARLLRKGKRALKRCLGKQVDVPQYRQLKKRLRKESHATNSNQ